MSHPNYKKTLTTCYLEFITQAITANFAPLLFLRFHTEYGIPFGKIALLSSTFYTTQILVDVFCAKLVILQARACLRWPWDAAAPFTGNWAKR